MRIAKSERPCPRPGWTLIEVLVALAIVAVLIALLVPAVIRVREAANKAACAQHLKQLALASHACHDSTGFLPPYSTGQPGTTVFGGWFIHLLPFVSEAAFHEEILNASGDTASAEGTLSSIPATQSHFRSRRFAILTCSSDPSLGSAFFGNGTSNYLANWYVFGDGTKGCYVPAQRLRNVENGVSNAVLFAEGYSNCNNLVRPALIACGTHNFGITWHGKPSDDASYLPDNYLLFQTMPPMEVAGCCDSLRAQTPHVAMPAAFADGSVHFITPDISLEAWTPMMKARNP
jgi:prepilin-type N-terminal cleavage/methylation domain-containing protein